MRLLVIDNHRDEDHYGAPALCKSLQELGSGATVFVRRAPEEDLPFFTGGVREKFDRIVISGSRTSIFSKEPWTQKLIDFTRSAVNQKVPILGICYGHQILGLSLGGKAGLCSTPQSGFKEIEVLDTSSLFHEMPHRIQSYCMNREEICSLPKGTKKLAQSRGCPIESFQIENAPAFGVQFHPEKSDPINQKIFENFLRL